MSAEDLLNMAELKIRDGSGDRPWFTPDEVEAALADTSRGCIECDAASAEIERLKAGNANLIKNAEILAEEVIQFCAERDGALAKLAAETDYANQLHTKLTHRLAEIYAERDDARQRLANVTSAHDDLKRANDQLHVARDNTARLLEEAREETARERARVAEEIAAHFIAAGNDVNQNLAWMYPSQAAEIARQHAGGEGGAVSAWDKAEARFNAASEDGAEP